ncbi:hypothetical protein ACFOLA_04465 [Salinicoccus hispanicus]|uniref:Uncharacterized protein n=1 Tax=Salinicoccus hispanicus TaxID=157225 RepID=A0A6N8U8R2_9STAP|nr:hypothetical protein [Salinicoccus hispanicus]MXQ52069.1 hypothetical protein [Salinicoccus hispanicus]
MKEVKLSKIQKRNRERREDAIRAVRRVNPDFKPGDRYFDKPGRNPEKQRILDEMRRKAER